MSLKTIREAALRITTEGDQQAVRTLKEISASITTADAKLRMIEAQFGKNSQSVQALTAKHQALTDKLAAQQERTARLRAELEAISAEYGENSIEAEKHRAKIVNSETAEKQLENQLKKTSAELQKQSSGFAETAAKCEQLGKSLEDAGKKMQDAGKKLSMYVTGPLVAAGTAALKTSIDFETAFTGVRKTVDGTTAQLEKIKQGIIDMSMEIPASTTEIAAVAEAAGQLGIETDNILGFTRAMIDLGETTNINATEGAQALAQFANITQMSQHDFDRLGSTIVALGNNFETNENAILEMSQRLAGAGTQIGLTEAQIMGFATALASVGIEAQAGGSAFSRVFSDMQVAVETGSAALEDFARVSGMTSEEFTKAFKDDAAGAITAFIEGLSKMDEKGISSIVTLEQMGITELRLRDSLLRTANAGELVRSAIGMANTAWDENIALSREANLRYGTTASQLKMLWNEVKELARQFGEEMAPALKEVIEWVKPLIKEFTNLTREQKANVLKWAAIAAAIGPVLTVLGTLTKGVGGLIRTFGSLSASIAEVGGIGAAMAGPAGWIMLGVGAFAALIGAVFNTIKAYRELYADSIELDEAMSAVNDGIKAANDSYTDSADKVNAAAETANKYIDELAKLEEAGLNTAESQLEYKTIVAELKSLIPDLNIEIDEQTGLIKGSTKALWLNVEAWKRTALEEAAYAQTTEKLRAHTEAAVKLTEAKIKLKRTEEELTRKQDEARGMLERMAAATGKTVEELWAMDAAERGQLLLNSDLLVSYNSLNSEIGLMEMAMSALKDEIADGEITVSELADALGITDEAVQTYLDTVGNTGPIDASTESMSSLAAAAEDVDKKISEMRDTIINSFTRMDEQTKTSVDKMVADLQYNVDQVRQWSQNLKTLAAEGVDLGLLAELEKMGPASIPYVNAMIEADAEELAELETVFHDATNLANTAAQLELEKLAGIATEATDPAVSAMYDQGTKVGGALADGLRSQIGPVQAAAAELAAAASVGGSVIPFPNIYDVPKGSGNNNTTNNTTTNKTINVTQNITTPKPASPAQVSRATKNALQQGAMLW
jgi:TP901 family phage tail tape measure protein